MLLMVEKGIRGGVSMISTRYGKSNNKYMGDSFIKKDPSKYIPYNGFFYVLPIFTNFYASKRFVKIRRVNNYSVKP